MAMDSATIGHSNFQSFFTICQINLMARIPRSADHADENAAQRPVLDGFDTVPQEKRPCVFEQRRDGSGHRKHKPPVRVDVSAARA
jgi:hypothetical protein